MESEIEDLGVEIQDKDEVGMHLTPSTGIIGYVFVLGISQSDSVLHDRARP